MDNSVSGYSVPYLRLVKDTIQSSVSGYSVH